VGSPCTHEFLPGILHIRKDSLGVYGKGFDEISEKEGTFSCVLHMRQNSLCAFSINDNILYAHSQYTQKFVLQIWRQILRKGGTFYYLIFLDIFGYTNAKTFSILTLNSRKIDAAYL
jgi:hypothetical protein